MTFMCFFVNDLRGAAIFGENVNLTLLATFTLSMTLYEFFMAK